MSGRQENKERGFWSAFMLMLTVTLALLGFGGAVLIRSEAVAVSRKSATLQTDYAADAAMHFAIRAMQLGTYDDDMTIPELGGVTVSVDTVSSAGGVSLYIDASKLEANRSITVNMTGALGAIIASGNVYWRVWSLNEWGWFNRGLTDEYVTTLPPVDTTALRTLAASQGYEKLANFTPPANYPSGSFYTVDGVTPYVTYVDGNLTITNNITVYGIFVVTGTVTIGTNAQIQGVVYSVGDVHLDPYGSRSSIVGGLITGGDVINTGSWWYVSSVRYHLDYIETFEDFGNVGHSSEDAIYYYVDNITYY
ncbi:hypothetical protein JXO52_01305 [bacterium]|nr:hypothetical protein [bacterium]